ASDDDLIAFDREVLPIVRAAMPNKLVLFEPNAVRNVVGRSPIATDSIGAGTVYAPHVYTLAFNGSTEEKEAVTKDQLDPSNASARDEADGFRAPLVITEFGFDSTVSSFANYIRWQYELQDQYLASSFYWVWKEYGTWGFYDIDASGNATERPAVFAAHARVRLEAVAGRLVSVGYDSDAKRFEAVFVGDPNVTAPNLVSVGQTPGFANAKATCDGNEVAIGTGNPLSIPCNGSSTHTIVVTPQ
ncbi:MAG TPA: cellulase family glycosylhydrolase, partial [Polyangiaceae bacterium]